MRPSFAQSLAFLPAEDQAGVKRMFWTHLGLGVGIPIAAFVWGLSRHGLLTTIDLFLHPATLFAGAAFYTIGWMVFGLVFSGATAVDHWWRTREGEADTDVH